MEDPEVHRAIIYRAGLPPQFPTHRHSSEFWEQLGRTVATFGFLEEVLGRAIFALTATRNYPPEEIDAAYEAWIPKLEKAFSDPLRGLAKRYGQEARDNQDACTELAETLVKDIKEAAELRNVLCHGSWGRPDSEGASVPLFVNRQKQIWRSKIDTAYLKRLQSHVAELSYRVIDSVTLMGWQFPGGAGPGKPIIDRS